MPSKTRLLYEECEEACRSCWNDVGGMAPPLRLVVARRRVKLMTEFPDTWSTTPEWLELQEVAHEVGRYAHELRLGPADHVVPWAEILREARLRNARYSHE